MAVGAGIYNPLSARSLLSLLSLSNRGNRVTENRSTNHTCSYPVAHVLFLPRFTCCPLLGARVALSRDLQTVPGGVVTQASCPCL